MVSFHQNLAAPVCPKCCSQKLPCSSHPTHPASEVGVPSPLSGRRGLTTSYFYNQGYLFLDSLGQDTNLRHNSLNAWWWGKELDVLAFHRFFYFDLFSTKFSKVLERCGCSILYSLQDVCTWTFALWRLHKAQTSATYALPFICFNNLFLKAILI